MMRKKVWPVMDGFIYLLNLFGLIGWIIWLIAWIARGMPTPRWVHRFAVILFMAGVVISTVVVKRYPYLVNYKLVGFFLLGMPLLAYIIWSWFLPDLAETIKKKHPKQKTPVKRLKRIGDNQK